MPPKTQTAPVKASGPKKGVSSPHKRVKSAKPPRSVEEQLERHFTSLCAQIDGGFFKNAIKTCDRILRIVPTDEDTLRTKLFLLLQTDQYKSALELIDTPTLGKSSSSVNQLEKAYILYRLHREQEAREILDAMSVEGSGRGVQHLDAQVKFRQGDYHGARELYNELLATCPAETDEYPDILVNLDASQTHIDFLEKDYLTGVHALPTNQSASALEALPAPSIVAALSTITNSTPGAGPGPSTAAARASGSEPHAAAAKRSRKSRVPKHVVPGVTPPPDPERWLKKRERTARYDGGRRWRNAKHTGLGTQGSAVADSTPGSGPGASSKAASGSGANPTGHVKKGKKGK